MKKTNIPEILNQNDIIFIKAMIQFPKTPDLMKIFGKSKRTIEGRALRISKKLGVSGRVQIVTAAFATGIITKQDLIKPEFASGFWSIDSLDKSLKRIGNEYHSHMRFMNNRMKGMPHNHIERLKIREVRIEFEKQYTIMNECRVNLRNVFIGLNNDA